MKDSSSRSRLVLAGQKSYEWAKSRMSLIDRITRDFSTNTTLPLEGLKLGLCLHITKETSVLIMALKALGAKMALCSANPLSIQNDIACYLQDQKIQIFATIGESYRQYHDNIVKVIRIKPDIVTDDGAELHLMAHKFWDNDIVAGTEETTSGVTRLKKLEFGKLLRYPVIAVNNAKTKHLFDNRYGTGQSTVDGLLRTTSLFLPGKHVIVCGYGWVGKGVAARLRGMGAIVTVTEIDPIKALEAHMEGYEVGTLASACRSGDIFITCTGSYRVIRKEHIDRMKDGATLCNAGHFDFEIDIEYLKSQDERPRELRPNVQEYTVNGRAIYLLASGRVINLVGAEGHPPEVMALSFANQLASIIYLAKNMCSLESRVYDVPSHIDHMVSEYALDTFGISVERTKYKSFRI